MQKAIYKPITQNTINISDILYSYKTNQLPLNLHKYKSLLF